MRQDARGRVCIHKRPWTRFSQQLTFTLSLECSTPVDLFTSHYFCHFFSQCGDLWPYFTRGFVLYFCCHLCFVGIARSHVSVQLFHGGVFLALSCIVLFFKGGNGAIESVSGDFLMAFPRICEVNLIQCIWEFVDGLTNCPAQESFLTCSTRETKSKDNGHFCIHIKRT